MFDGEVFGQQMVEIVRGYVSAELATLVERNAQLEARLTALESRAIVVPEIGDPGPSGEDGKDGADGMDGKDGTGLADALIDNEGRLVITMTDGRTKTLGRVVGRDGVDGENGAAGETFTLDDFDLKRINERSIALCFAKDGSARSFDLEFPVMIFRGVWKDSETYDRGDVVTWGGSSWHCNEAKGAKPDSGDSGWQLMVKRGRDGKAGV